QRNAVAELDDTLHIVQRFHTALRNTRIQLGELIRELLESSELDRQLLQVATVEPDEHLLLVSFALIQHFTRKREIVRIERFEQHEHLEHRRAIEKYLDSALIQHACADEHTARTGGARFHHLIRVDEEILAHHGNVEWTQRLRG